MGFSGRYLHCAQEGLFSLALCAGELFSLALSTGELVSLIHFARRGLFSLALSVKKKGFSRRYVFSGRCPELGCVVLSELCIGFFIFPSQKSYFIFTLPLSTIFSKRKQSSTDNANRKKFSLHTTQRKHSSPRTTRKMI